jgi:tRNA-specific 2-thiouridylase
MNYSKALDPSKDQSYFLHRLNQAQLSKTLFPVGELLKTEVRRIADEIGLPNAKKKDSTGICFIGERPFREFLNRYIQKEPGPIKDGTPLPGAKDYNRHHGRTIGQHVGLSFYTLGQRQGLGIGGLKAKGAQKGGGEHTPWFVARKDMAANTLWVVQGHDHPWLQSSQLQRARRQLDQRPRTRPPPRWLRKPATGRRMHPARWSTPGCRLCAGPFPSPSGR